LKKYFLIIFFLSVTPLTLYSQEPDKSTKADSAKIYKAIQKIAKKKNFSNWLFSLIFTIPEKAKKPSRKVTQKTNPKNYSYFEGKIIRRIDILTLDPFGYDIKDTSVKPEGFMRKTGNDLHIKTLSIAIKNLLLIKQNQPFDSLLVKESERLIRKQKYVHDIILNPQRIKNEKDSVDIYIRVLDNWSLTPRGHISTTGIGLGFTDQNFLGTGQQFDNIYNYGMKSRRSAYETSYYIPNIKNTYIGGRIQYQINEDRSFIKAVDLERTFFSSFTKWGGGIHLGQHLNKDSISFPDSSSVFQNFKYNIQDLWFGKAWRIFGGKSELNRTTNFIASARFQHINYLEGPTEIYDSLRVYTSERFWLWGLGVTSRQYVQDKYIFKYGLVEDIPEGKQICFTGGYQIKNNRGRFYWGIKTAWGNYFRWGYLSTDIEYGRFFYKGSFEEGALTIGINYFSHLIDVGKWKIRQFIKPQLIMGIKRLPTDKIKITEEYGIAGFNPTTEIYGIHKALLTIQTQSYAPWNLIGFRFGPYVVYSLGILGDAKNGFRGNKVYSLLGFGMLIKNDFLVFKTFQISFSFYPIIPGKGNNISKINAYKTTDFGFRDFDIEKPATVTYQ
jgi:hypothetical protein